MSKKKKASPGKAGKNSPAKKTAKKAVKPAAKKKVTKKVASKPEKTKKAAKKSPAKPSPSAKKKIVKKIVTKPAKTQAKTKVQKKISKPVQKAVHKPVNGKKLNGNKVEIKASQKIQPSKLQPLKTKSKPSPELTVNSKHTNNKHIPEKKGALPLKPEHKSNGVSKETSKEIPIKVTAQEEKSISKKQQAERKSGEVLAISNTIPVKQKNEISPSKIASISYSITNPVKRTDSYAIKPEKEPNGKFELEFVVHASAEMLYEFLSSPSGLSEWFCDDLNIRNGIYTFIWDDQLQQARLLKTVDLHLVRFQWVDKTDGSYFEFKIQRDDLTNDISLIITDFAETVSERESSKLLWHSQVEKLMHVIGSIF